MELSYFIEQIKSNIDTRTLFEYYGFSPNRAGFVVCPFHAEKTPSLKVYSGDKGWHCFGCGAGGDVIDFVSRYFNLSFYEAITKINNDFNLGLPINKKLDKRYELEILKRNFNQRQKLKKQQEEKEKIEQEYWQAFDEWKRLAENKVDYRPKTADEEIHPLYVEALQKIDEALLRVQILDDKRNYKNENRNSKNS